MQLKIVENEEELKDAYRVRTTVFVDEQKVPMELEIDEFDTTATHLVLYDQSEPIGAGRFRVIDGIGKVERICVLKDHRNTGAGVKIMESIEDIAREKNIHQLKLNAQTHAEGFYKKLGYETISEVFMDAGIPHVTMKKNIG